MKQIPMLFMILLIVGCTPRDETPEVQHFGAVQGIVTDVDTMQPLENAVVMLDSSLQTETDSLGEFRFDDIQSGEHEIAVSLLDYAQVVRNIHVAPDSISTVHLHLHCILAGAVEGRVTRAANGLPMADVNVAYEAGSVVTGPDGHFRIDSIAPGQQVLTLTKPKYVESQVAVLVHSRMTTNQDVSMPIDLPLVMEGTWLSAGENVAPLLVSLYQTDTVRVTFTGSTIILEEHRTESGWRADQVGSFMLGDDSVQDIHGIEIDYTEALAYEQAGIVRVLEANPDEMQLEVVVPYLAHPPTPEDGFGAMPSLGSMITQLFARE